MKKGQIIRLTLTFLFAFLFFSGCTPSQTPSEGGKQAKEGELPKSQTEAHKSLPDYLQKLLENLKEPSTIFVAANNSRGDVVAIDSSSDKEIWRVPFQGEIFNLALKPDGSELYVSSEKSKKIYILDLDKKKIVGSLSFKDGPSFIAFMPDGTKAYVTHYPADYISVIDVAKKEIVKTIKAGKHPVVIAITYDGKKAYVGHSIFVDFSKQKTMKIRGITVPVGLPSFSEGPKEVTIIDLSKDEVEARLSVPGLCNGIAVRPDNKLVYAAISSVDVSGIMGGKIKKGKEDTILVIDIDTNKVVAKIKFEPGSGPKAIAFTPDSKKAYAICGVRDDATVIDAQRHKIIKRIPLKLGG